MIIPLSGFPDENFSLSLNNTLYQFNVKYNGRFDYWSLSMFENDVPLFEGVKLVQGVNLTELYLLDIGGYLTITSISGDDSDPTRDDLGKDKVLNFVPFI